MKLDTAQLNNSFFTENPLKEGLFEEHIPEPCIMVIFGSSGDLTSRKLVPALFDQFVENHLPPGFTILGCGRTSMTDETFREKMRQSVEKFSRKRDFDSFVWEKFSSGIFYFNSDFTADEQFASLGVKLKDISLERNSCGNFIFYMAVPAVASKQIIQGLSNAGLNKNGFCILHDAEKHGYSRIIVEKPFGRDLESAKELNNILAKSFNEEQIYRIDHYLGKETVQNILVFRFANGIFEPVWNQKYIDNVQIIAGETIGVEGRASYYEGAGALRDMVQNHMLQLLSLVAMEPPTGFKADFVRDEKIKVLHAIRPIKLNDVNKITVRGQYVDGWIGGKEVIPYRGEPDVNPNSVAETYCAIKLFIDNWRWAGVPFYLRTGKRLPKRVTEIAIQFKQVPHLLFRQTLSDQIEPNLLILRIQPDEGISLKFGAKLPGHQIRLRSVKMDFHYGTSFGASSPEAYERLLVDCMLGDSTLFHRSDAIEASWDVIMPILEAWSSSKAKSIPFYEAGTWGPEEAEHFIEQEGRTWRRL